MIRKQRLAGPALALCVAAAAAPSAWARPIDLPPRPPDAADRAATLAPAPPRRVAEASTSAGFDWGDAGIGAGAALAAAALAGALVLSGRADHDRNPEGNRA